MIDELEERDHLETALDIRRTGHDLVVSRRDSWRSKRLSRQLGVSCHSGWPRVVSTTSGSVVAIERRSLPVNNVILANLETVTQALDSAGVTYWIVPIDSVMFHRIGVRDIHRQAVWDALRDAADGELYLEASSRSSERRIPFAHWAGTTPGNESSHDSWRVYKNYAAGPTNDSIGIEHCCQIEFWHRDNPHEIGASTETSSAIEDASSPWCAPGRNLVANGLPVDFRILSKRRIAGHDFPTVDGFELEANPKTIGFDVDVVYTWVDGSDPEWQKRKERVASDLAGESFNREATHASRFIDRQELKYSIRSLEAFADFVRHIWIVTDNQVPEWLDTDNPRVSIVDHSDIIGDRGKTPTFNSHPIEASLHRIEGLSEHYLYMNDDFLFGRRVSPEKFFFSNGIWKFFPSRATIGLGPPSVEDAPVDAAAKNGRDLIRKRFGVEISNKLKHGPHPQRRSVAAEMEETFADAFEMTMANQFRSRTDISTAASLIHHYGFATGRAVPQPISSTYIDVSGHDLAGKLRSLNESRNVDVWCLNDEDSCESDEERQRTLLDEFFQSFLPIPSSFERSGPT